MVSPAAKYSFFSVQLCGFEDRVTLQRFWYRQLVDDSSQAGRNRGFPGTQSGQRIIDGAIPLSVQDSDFTQDQSRRPTQIVFIEV